MLSSQFFVLTQASRSQQANFFIIVHKAVPNLNVLFYCNCLLKYVYAQNPWVPQKSEPMEPMVTQPL